MTTSPVMTVTDELLAEILLDCEDSELYQFGEYHVALPTARVVALVEHIRSLTELLKAAWVSVNERMPSEGAEVIVSGWAYNDPEQGRYVAHAEFSDGVFKPSGAADEYDTLHPPTHWMPLPTAPAISNEDQSHE